MDAFGFEKANYFDVREREFEFESGKVRGSNAYYTLFNHGGPHLDMKESLRAFRYLPQQFLSFNFKG